MEKVGMSLKAAAAYIGVSPAGLRLFLREHRAPKHYRAGRLIRFRKEEIDRWIEANSEEGGESTY